MVDYYALISPTIEPLAGASPEERQVVYRRLVDMLDQQLRAADPPRSDKSILKERIELESAIRRVERHILARQKPTPPISASPQPTPPDQSTMFVSQGEIPSQTPLRKDITGISRFVTPKEETPVAFESEPLDPEIETVSSFEEESNTIDYESVETLPSTPEESLHDEPSLG